jgi:transcription antitermination factor NusG
MDTHFLLESCNWVVNQYVSNVRNVENISYVKNFVGGTYDPLKKKDDECQPVIHKLTQSSHNSTFG